MAEAHDDLSAPVIAVAVVMSFLSTLAVILRWWPRLLSRKADFWFDDYLAIAALPFALGLNAVTLYWVSLGLGKHQSATAGDAPNHFFCFWVSNFFYNTSLALVKISVLLFYGRVFHISTIFKTTLWGTALLILAWWTAVDILDIIQCQPVSRFWYRDLPGSCIGLFNILVSTAAPNVAIDVVLLLMPLPTIWRLPVKASRRLSLSVLFMLGYCVLGVSIIRLCLVLKMTRTPESDLTWNMVPHAILLSIESSLAIISICLPRIFNLLRKGIAHLSSGSRETPSPTRGMNGPAAQRLGNMGIAMEVHRSRMQGKPISMESGPVMMVTTH